MAERQVIAAGPARCFAGRVCRNRGVLDDGKDSFKSASITLTDGVIINYFTLLSADELADPGAYVHFNTEHGLDVMISFSEAVGDNLRNIRPQDLDEMYTFTVSDGEGTTTLEYSAFSYMKNVLDNAGSYDKALVNLINAMYDYNAAANAYANRGE